MSSCTLLIWITKFLANGPFFLHGLKCVWGQSWLSSSLCYKFPLSLCVGDACTFIKKVGVERWTLHVIFLLEWFIAELIFTTWPVPNTLVISMSPKSPNFIAVRTTFDSINTNKRCYNTAQQIGHSVLFRAAFESLVRKGSMELRDAHGESLVPRHFGRHCDALSRDGSFRSFELMESSGLLLFLLRVSCFGPFAVANKGNTEISKFLTGSKLKVAFEYFFSAYLADFSCDNWLLFEVSYGEEEAQATSNNLRHKYSLYICNCYLVLFEVYDWSLARVPWVLQWKNEKSYKRIFQDFCRTFVVELLVFFHTLSAFRNLA